MPRPYRIIRKQKSLGLELDDNDKNEEIEFFMNRLMKLVPSDVLGFYLIGNVIIPKENNFPIIWFLFCVLVVFVSRFYGTKGKNSDPQYPTILISSISFILWVYLVGGPFIDMKIHVPWLGALLVLVWTYFVPIFYEGDVK